MDRNDYAKFMRQVDTDGPDWLWAGPQIARSGYGKFRVAGGKERPAHVVLWEHYHGPVPEGMQLDHMKDREPFCGSRLCVRPDHLEPVTPAENTTRQDHAERRVTKCPQGHPYDEQNTLVGADGKRRCRTCRASPTRSRARQATP